MAGLHVAIQEGNEEMVQTCLNNGADVNVIYSRETALTLAIETHHVHIATRILNHPHCSVNTCNAWKRSPLFCAAKESCAQLVEVLLEMGADIDIRDWTGMSPLASTAFYNSYETAAILIQHRARINEQDNKGRTPLYLACSNVCLEMVELLLAHGADVNLGSDHLGQTPLMAAIPSSYERDVRHKRLTDMISIMKALIDNGCDVNAIDSQGRTTLHLAVDENEIHAACLLLESGINLDICDNDEMTTLHMALRPDSPQYELALYLLLYGCNANCKMPIAKGSKTKLLPLIVLLKSNPKQLSDRKLRKKLLHILLQCSNLSRENLIELLHYFNSPNLAEHDELDIFHSILSDLSSSLHHVCCLTIRKSLGQNYLLKVKQLSIPTLLKRFLRFGYHFNFDPLKVSALHTSIQDNDAESVCALLKEGVDINTTVNSISPLCLAAKLGNIRMVEILLNHNSDPTKRDFSEQTALHIAAKHGKSEIINLFLKLGCDVNVQNGDGNSALLEGAIHGHFDVCLQLAVNGGSLCEQTAFRVSPLHLASASGDVFTIRRMVAAGVDINAVDFMGNTSLHLASSKGVIYLKNNISLPAMYKEEVLECMDTCEMQMSDTLPKYTRKDVVNHRDTIKVLLEAGCDGRILNNDAKTAEDITREFGFMELFQ